MGNKINFWSFVLSWLCLILFFIRGASSHLKNIIIAWTGIHPLIFILYLTLIVFILSVFGFCGISNWVTAIRSFFTAILCSGLLIILTYTILIGALFELP
ncbi:hypothetical protein SAMN05660649_01383 [Desulfotomaculum arcticum]|uniref:Uncharacterized protein n=1 Tax=Desulfotruncus arcticus DSM 17038 TaxID=1121424 RepID=A0A1I2R498_9FIRM|nr:hypothetical protein [Desulfotruncus arcticus]SFG35298.1 hypothetical protein SAMN05660649_01383 [Desulfotomaculum arcticum] [Desulfotruncus arcticus DSM 17038]